MIGQRSRGETDITAVFGTAIPGSNPGGSTCQEKRTAPPLPHYVPCADTGNRTTISSLARTRSTTKPYPQFPSPQTLQFSHQRLQAVSSAEAISAICITTNSPYFVDTNKCIIHRSHIRNLHYHELRSSLVDANNSIIHRSRIRIISAWII